MNPSILALTLISIAFAESLKVGEISDATIADDVTRETDEEVKRLLDETEEELNDDLAAILFNDPGKKKRKKKQGKKKRKKKQGKKKKETGEKSWPAKEETTKCTQTTKQKAMYASFSMTPTLRVEPATEVNLKITWDSLQGAPWTSSGKGGTYAAYTVGMQGASGGYFGSQLSRSGNSKTGYRHQFLFSIWDGDRWVKGSNPRKFKPSNSLAWPMGTNCKRNCQDCGMSHLKGSKKEGLTTGAQCPLPDPDAMIGVTYEFTLKRTKVKHTINTRDYGGMPKSHAKYGEKDRKITGDVWKLTATNEQTKKSFSVGEIMFEGATGGLEKLGTFDEMLGCNKCNDVYHKDTRTVPVIDGNIRRVTGVKGKAKSGSSCKKYNIQGVGGGKWFFEGGPGFQEGIPVDGESHKLVVWK